MNDGREAQRWEWWYVLGNVNYSVEMEPGTILAKFQVGEVVLCGNSCHPYSAGKQ